MKRFSVAIVFLLACASVLALSRQQMKDLNNKCNSDPATAVDGEQVKKWRQEGGEKPANSGPHAFCMAKELGWQDADGKVSKDAMKAQLTSLPAAEVEEILEKCAVEQTDKYVTAMTLIDCVLKSLRKHGNDHQ